MRLLIYLSVLFFCSSCDTYGQQVAVAGFGHAHNDYEKSGRKDFEDAILNACNSIEIDVFPKGDELKVSHIPLFLGSKGNLEDRYIGPLANYCKNKKTIFEEDSIRLILMIDVKRNPTKAYQLIKKLAAKYKNLFAVWDKNGKLIKNAPVELLISGAKPYQLLLEDSIRYMRIDGDFGKIGDTIFNASIVPRVSTNYNSFFSWKGKGEMPKEEEDKLRKLIEKADADGREVRFWAMPNKLVVWQKMREMGVDWLNVDDIKKFKEAVRNGMLK